MLKRSPFALCAAATLMIFLTACQKSETPVTKGPAEQVGAQLDVAAEKAREKLNVVGEKTGQALQKASEKTAEALKKGGEKLEQASKDAQK